MTERRGALPLALLIFAVLIAGVVVAVIRVGEDRGPGKAAPTDSPGKTATPPPKTPSPTPTDEPTGMATPTDEPTGTATPTPSPTPTDEPTDEPTTPTSPGGGGVNGTPTDGPTPLAKTGGESAPWMILGALLVGFSAVLARLARRPS